MRRCMMNFDWFMGVYFRSSRQSVMFDYACDLETC